MLVAFLAWSVSQAPSRPGRRGRRGPRPGAERAGRYLLVHRDGGRHWQRTCKCLSSTTSTIQRTTSSCGATPYDVHLGLAEQHVAERGAVLATAYAAHLERLPAGRPRAGDGAHRGLHQSPQSRARSRRSRSLTKLDN